MIGTVIIRALNADGRVNTFQRIQREEIRRMEVDAEDNVVVWHGAWKISIDPDPEAELNVHTVEKVSRLIFEDLATLVAPRLYSDLAVALWTYRSKDKLWSRCLVHISSGVEHDHAEFAV